MIKPIETEYKGYRFRSRLEARWAVFFDACGVKWEYEPEGFDLGDGLYYLPDFLLHDVIYRLNQVEEPIDLWVEVKGKFTNKDRDKIWTFISAGESYGYLHPNPTIVFSNVPDGTNFDEIVDSIQYADDEDLIFNFGGIDCDNFTAIPVITKERKLALAGAEYYVEGVDEKATFNAYKKARQARFEYGEHGGNRGRCLVSGQ